MGDDVRVPLLDHTGMNCTEKAKEQGLDTYLTKSLHHFHEHWPVELQLLKQQWKWLLFAGCWQYVHSVATNLVYYLHEASKEPIKDLGFDLFPAFDEDDPLQEWLSELFFGIIMGVAVLVALLPLFDPSSPKRNIFVIYTLKRYAVVLVICQTLRIVSFLCTVLPSPNYHCREGSEDYDPPETVWDILFRMDATFGCGDLIFSSHTLFSVLCCIIVHVYCPVRAVTVLSWMLLLVLAALTLMSRKHYSVDIVVAWYTVPLVWFAYTERYPLGSIHFPTPAPNPELRQSATSLC
eukprot:Rmarinus@m.8286